MLQEYAVTVHPPVRNPGKQQYQHHHTSKGVNQRPRVMQPEINTASGHHYG
ncbi:hypothetical protein ZU64_004624 [Salmonella enterica subsp. diarizonae]|nr:hypothetical protein [Salmonella enterica subsp. diarizonae]